MEDHAANIALANTAQMALAAEILRSGGLVAFPTETVYGLGADATNDRAVARIFETKGRPRFNPLIVHLLNAEWAQRFVTFTRAADRLALRFWPGPLTLALPRRKECPLSLLVSAGLETVALRVPAHATARALLEASGLPIAAPSANRSGRVSPTKAEHVAADMGTKIDLILDGGAAVCGIESTVIGFQSDAPILLRSGVITREEIEEVAGPLTIPSTPAISSPGQMASHYAPETALRLNATRIEPEEALLAFGAAPEHAGTVRNLSPYGDLREAAANLFAMLRELDGSGATRIAVMPIPGIGLGDAINDRLRRAAAPRVNE